MRRMRLRTMMSLNRKVISRINGYGGGESPMV